MTVGEDEEERGYASPACFMHEVDPAYFGLSPSPDRRTWAEVAAWRKAERGRLIKARLELAVAERRSFSEQIAAGLDRLIGDPSGRTISFYWPFRGEPDLRDWMSGVHGCGGRCSLPVVVTRHQPLVFRQWEPGARLDRGVWNIPIPADGGEVAPDIVIAPVVGFDATCYRLGYGGGFFDRTLAAMPVKPRIIGVGYAQAAMATIVPQHHDIPMDVIVTEQEILEPIRDV
jgi:5,10-methenyltetrahydrofolate synthetase